MTGNKFTFVGFMTLAFTETTTLAYRFPRLEYCNMATVDFDGRRDVVQLYVTNFQMEIFVLYPLKIRGGGREFALLRPEFDNFP